MSQFESDSEREAAIGDFLDTHLYPAITERFRRESEVDRQHAGIDVTARLPGSGHDVCIDEKSQSSTPYLGDPTRTFVMEIFGETTVRSGNLRTSTGWFVDESKQTDFYLFVWVTESAYFTARTFSGGIELVYHTPTPSRFERRLAEDDVLRSTFLGSTQNGEYRTVMTPVAVELFEDRVEPVPESIQTIEDPNPKEGFLTADNIRELRVALVDRSKLLGLFETAGLDRETLFEIGTTVAKTGERRFVRPEDIEGKLAQLLDEDRKSLSVVRSERNGENPVNVVVPYTVYHEVAQGTWVLRPDERPTEERLFQTCR